MRMNLIIDGNFMLSKITHNLHKNNLLFGALENSLEFNITKYKNIYPFSNVFLVSDSKGKSWRKKLTTTYKEKRQKDNSIDWNFVYETYGNFKAKTNIKTFECPSVEGDDWISFLVEESNKKGYSTFIISNDSDFEQLIKFDYEKQYINMMYNDVFKHSKVFLPENYKVFLNMVNDIPNDDIFNMNNNSKFISTINDFIMKHRLIEVNNTESLYTKILRGDKSDDIPAVWISNKGIGIGPVTAKKIYSKYLEEFGDVKTDDPLLEENFADLVCENKKLSKSNIETIKENIISNNRFINLNMNNLPTEITELMRKEYERVMNP